MIHHFVQHIVFRARRGFAGQRQEQAHVGAANADACSPVARVNAVAGDEVPVKDFVFHALHAVADGRENGVVPVAQPVFTQENTCGCLGDGPPALGAGEGDVVRRLFNDGVIFRVARGHQGQPGPARIIMVAAVAARTFPGTVLALLGRQPFAHHVDNRLALGAVFGEAEGIGAQLGYFKGDVFTYFFTASGRVEEPPTCTVTPTEADHLGVPVPLSFQSPLGMSKTREETAWACHTLLLGSYLASP